MSFDLELRSLESVCDLITDGSHFSPVPQADGYPIVNAKDIPDGRINLDSCTRISQADYETLKKQNCAPKPGDVLLSKDGTIGRVVYYGSDLGVVVLSSVAILRAKASVDSAYLAQTLCSDDFRRQLLMLESGSALRRIILRDIKKLEFCFPKQCEQAKIAEILSIVDRAIEQTETLIAKQHRIKTGLMQYFLTRGIDENGNLRSEQTHQFKDSPLGRIPVGWKVKELGHLVDEPITYGIVQAGPHVEDGVPYIRTGDMSEDAILLSELLRTSSTIAKSYKRSEVHVGDIVFALRATVGKVLPVSEELNGANLTQGTAKISPAKSVDSNFLLWALRTFRIQQQIRVHQKGTTFMEITLNDLRGIMVALPENIEEQSLIGDVLSKHDSMIGASESNLIKLRSLKTALMQDLLTGRKRVTPLLETEPKREKMHAVR